MSKYAQPGVKAQLLLLLRAKGDKARFERLQQAIDGSVTQLLRLASLQQQLQLPPLPGRFEATMLELEQEVGGWRWEGGMMCTAT